MRATLRLAALAALCAGAGACLGPVDAPMSATLGDSVASMDNQIIDPRPAAGLPETSGAKAAAAIRRYERGEVFAPEAASSTLGGGGGGGEEAAPSEEGSPP